MKKASEAQTNNVERWVVQGQDRVAIVVAVEIQRGSETYLAVCSFLFVVMSTSRLMY